MNNRNFNEDHILEESNFEFQDAFYKSKGYRVERTLYETPEGKALQKKDIDVIITNNINGKGYSISEKYRPKYYGDISFEILHIFDDGREKRGWLQESEAAVLMYFADTQVFWLNLQKLKKALISRVLPLCKENFSTFVKSGKNREKYNSDILFTACHNDRGNYTSYCICLTPNYIKNLKIGVKKDKYK